MDNLKFHSLVIFVSNIEKSKDFYVRLLNQEIKHDFGKNVILNSGTTIWEVGKEHIISKELGTKDNQNKFELYFVSDNLEGIRSKLKQENVEFFHDIHEEPWGQRTFRFFDPDNHLVEIGEPLEIWITNLHKKGFSPEAIEMKSGVPLHTILDIL